MDCWYSCEEDVCHCIERNSYVKFVRKKLFEKKLKERVAHLKFTHQNHTDQ